MTELPPQEYPIEPPAPPYVPTAEEWAHAHAMAIRVQEDLLYHTFTAELPTLRKRADYYLALRGIPPWQQSAEDFIQEAHRSLHKTYVQRENIFPHNREGTATVIGEYIAVATVTINRRMLDFVKAGKADHQVGFALGMVPDASETETFDMLIEPAEDLAFDRINGNPELKALLDNARLCDREKYILWSCIVEDRDRADLAKELGLDPGHISVILHRTIAKLKKAAAR